MPYIPLTQAAVTGWKKRRLCCIACNAATADRYTHRLCSMTHVASGCILCTQSCPARNRGSIELPELLRKGPAMRKAFTLIELLVVIGIIALLMGLLLPGLALARRRAQSVVGNANMRSLSQTMMMYTHDNKDAFLNPFQYGCSCEDPMKLDLTDATTGRENVRWDFHLEPPDEEWTTEMFAFYWYSFLNIYDGTSPYQEEQAAPGDIHILSLAAEHSRGGGISADDLQLWPSSFLYSPTFWLSADRYQQAGWRPPNPKDVFGKTQYIASVTYPSSKALLFERSDFGQKDRIHIDEQHDTSYREGLMPAWNNIASSTAVATVDGSVEEIRMADLFGRANETDSDFMPSGLAAVTDGPPIKLVETIDPDTIGGAATTDGEYPLFFWATRYGIEGRDLPR